MTGGVGVTTRGWGTGLAGTMIVFCVAGAAGGSATRIFTSVVRHVRPEL
jgi:hypothetical protein